MYTASKLQDSQIFSRIHPTHELISSLPPA